MIEIVETKLSDMKVIEPIYAYAREYMRQTGNPNQWKDNRPLLSVLKRDIENGNSFLIKEECEICGVFSFIKGIDSTYLKMKEGQWLNDEPYGTIHRIASNGKIKGILKIALDFGLNQVENIRIDTHKDNKVMIHLLEKYGFKRCGVIIVDDGTDREAFQKVNKKKQSKEHSK